MITGRVGGGAPSAPSYLRRGERGQGPVSDYGESGGGGGTVCTVIPETRRERSGTGQ